MILNNLSANKSASKKREFNNFSTVTALVRKYKETNNENDLLEILKNLEGIINTYTLICTPSDSKQVIHITPYMCKFLGMFLSSEERINVNYSTYLHACNRIRWILRHYTYEDMYARLLEILIKIVRKMRIIGDCDCIYYIQKMTQYQMYDLIMKSSKDASTHVGDDHASDGIDDDDDYKYTKPSMNKFIAGVGDFDFTESLYNDISVYALIETFDFYKLLSQYEKYLLYLVYGLYFTNKQASLLIRHKKEKEILLDLQVLQTKILDASQEYLNA